MTNQPRVLQVVLSLNPGGTERLVIELARHLHADIPMSVCCLDEAGAWAPEVEQAGIHVTALGRRPGFHPSLALDVARAARAHRATVIHAHHYSPFVYSALARLVCPRLKVIFTEHGRLSDAGPSARRRRANQVLRHLAAGVFAVSEDVKQHLIDEGFAADSVGVIYNGIDVGPLPDARTRAAVRGEIGVRDDTLVLGTVARLDSVKDLATLLRAVGLLPRETDSVLLVVGDGPERAALEALTTELGIAGRVRFLGHRDDARRLLAGCDVYANSSISEGVSLTILEAMAAGLPVVATNVGGTPEVVAPDSGVLVPARDPHALASAIGTLGTNAARRQALGGAARRRGEQRFTLDRMIEQYRNAYMSDRVKDPA